MLDYTQSFQEFAQSLKPLDMALYAGIGLVLWAVFKDKLSPVQNFVTKLLGNIKLTKLTPKQEDVFFQLVLSWKQTRDLAVKSGCDEAVKVADQMFPYLSPTVCQGKNNE